MEPSIAHPARRLVRPCQAFGGYAHAVALEPKARIQRPAGITHLEVRQHLGTEQIDHVEVLVVDVLKAESGDAGGLVLGDP